MKGSCIVDEECLRYNREQNIRLKRFCFKATQSVHINVNISINQTLTFATTGLIARIHFQVFGRK